jgi:hypothetical protein
MQLVRGETDREQYLTAMRGLIARIKSDQRLQPVAEALDERRLLLNTEPIESASE